MASEYIQDFAFRQISQAIMATANSVASTASNSADGSSGEGGIFGVVRRKWEKVQDVIQGFAAPLKRRSMYDELPEHVWPREHIEMSRLVQRGLGHNFLPCQLTNPTWCDYCGDFIWGLYKQCLRCQTCQYTCHQHCLPAVTLNCKSVSDDGFDVAIARTPSPSDPRSLLETSLSMGNIYTRPGCARVVSSTSNIKADTATTTVGVQGVSESAPSCQHVAQGRGGAVGTGSSRAHPEFVYKHTDTPKPGHLPAHHLSRSASEGYVTAYSSTVLPPMVGTGPPVHTSLGHHISSPWCSPSYSDSQPDSGLQTHSSKQRQSIESESKATMHGSQPDNAGVHDKIIQGSSNFSVSDNTNNNSITQQLESSEDKLSDLQEAGANQEATTEKDETDSGYRSGTIPDDKLPRIPSQATLDRQELSRKIARFNHFVPAATLEVTGKESFQGFVKVTMNLIRPITMELGARPPSIYELLTKEHIVEENTQQLAFYMPRDTHKSLHITSATTTKEVVTTLLKKFHILDHPRKFAMYEQEFSDRNKLVRLRRLTDKDFPLRAILGWDPERIRNYRMVLQENETGEIVWDAFSLPELGNFLKVLDREEKEMILELKHKYAYMKQYMERRLAELRNERSKKTKT